MLLFVAVMFFITVLPDLLSKRLPVAVKLGGIIVVGITFSCVLLTDHFLMKLFGFLLLIGWSTWTHHTFERSSS